MSGVKGLNTTDSVNRVRFENLSQRLSKVNVDVVHKVRAHGSLDLHHSVTPSTGALGCHFQDELEHCKTLDTASHFKRLGLYHVLCTVLQWWCCFTFRSGGSYVAAVSAGHILLF